ncbi:metallophosphoesterase [Halocatena marina]|uniref:Phosphoesterase n=1 Tax=Halocatena marina TaxID=2934937 RepID=A0ABD5YV23_9EURY|nr:metallophosphoesterase [Halocatena marina]
MITVVSDTHGRDSHRLTDHALSAIREATLVLHAGDFVTESVLDAFEAESTRFAGVTGNNDSSTLRERLPVAQTVEYEGTRIALVHGHEHTDTGLALFGQQENADLLVVGHSHRPSFRYIGDLPVLNPGSHADPRWYRPAYAELELDPFRGRLIEPDGTLIDTFTV